MLFEVPIANRVTRLTVKLSDTLALWDFFDFGLEGLPFVTKRKNLCREVDDMS
jgi:hypothetical protein